MTGLGCRSCSSPPRAHVQADLSRGGFLRVLAPRKAQRLTVPSGEVAELGNRGAFSNSLRIPKVGTLSPPHPHQCREGPCPGRRSSRGGRGGEGGPAAHPENLPADVGDAVLLQGVPFCVLYQVCHRTSTAELHHQLWSQGAPEGKASIRQGLLPLPSPWRRTRGLGAQIGTSWRAGAT